MFPWVHGFHWDAGHLIFLGLFFSVVMVIFCTVTKACLKARQDFKSHKQEEILWEANFEDLPAAARICRHELSGEFQHRTCDNNFDCRRCATHAKLMAQSAPEKMAARRQEEPDIFGLNMPLDRFYHRGHTWAKPEKDGTITVGLDDLGARLIGKPDAIALPAVGTQVKANGTGWHVKKQRNDLRVLSPVDGEVIETGGPEKGWYLRVKPNGADGNMRHLLRGAEIRSWIMRELERLQLALAPEGLGMSLADGGVPVEDLSQGYPEADWDTVLGDMFLET